MALPTTPPVIGYGFVVHYIGPFISSGGSVYIISPVDGTEDELACVKATDPTDDSTWAEQDSVNRPHNPDNETYQQVIVRQEGDLLHVATYYTVLDMSATPHVEYHRFDMSTDSWVETNTMVVDNGNAIAGGDPGFGFVVRDNGDRIILYNQGGGQSMGTRVGRVSYALWDGSTWSVDNPVDNGGSDDWETAGAVLGASGRVHFYLVEQGTTSLYHRSLSSTNTLNTLQDTGFICEWGANMGDGFSWDDGGTIRVRMPFEQDGLVLQHPSVADPSFTTADFADNQVRETQNGVILHVLRHRASDASHHALYVDSTDFDLWRDVNEGSGWGTDTEIVVGSIDELAANIFDRNGDKLAFVYADSDVVHYDEVDLAAGTTFQQSVSGAVDFQGELSKKTSISLAGSLGPSGAISKKSAKAFAGSISPSGVLSRLMFEALAGSISPSGVLDRLVGKGLSGSIGPTGALSRKTLKDLAGSLSPSGSLSRKSFKSLAGSISPSGALERVKSVAQQLAGSVDFNGVLDTNFIPGTVADLYRRLIDLDTLDENADPRS